MKTENRLEELQNIVKEFGNSELFFTRMKNQDIEDIEKEIDYLQKDRKIINRENLIENNKKLIETLNSMNIKTYEDYFYEKYSQYVFEDEISSLLLNTYKLIMITEEVYYNNYFYDLENGNIMQFIQNKPSDFEYDYYFFKSITKQEFKEEIENKIKNFLLDKIKIEKKLEELKKTIGNL